MLPQDFVRTIYLGDRGCKGILVDGWNERVAITVDLISRIRSASGVWDFYSDEDIPDGSIVFTRVRSLRFDPPGFIPNDLINDLEVEQLETGAGGAECPPIFRFRVSIGAAAERGRLVEVVITIEAEGIHLEDPARPGVEIKE